MEFEPKMLIVFPIDNLMNGCGLDCLFRHSLADWSNIWWFKATQSLPPRDVISHNVSNGVLTLTFSFQVVPFPAHPPIMMILIAVVAGGAKGGHSFLLTLVGALLP